MTTPFDIRTEQLAEEYSAQATHSGLAKPGCAFTAGRNSAKESLEIAVRALRGIERWAFAGHGRRFNGNHKEVVKLLTGIAKEALAAITARGDNPLEQPLGAKENE